MSGDAFEDVGGQQIPGQVINAPVAPQQPGGQNKGSDPVCNGTGWLWQDAYGNAVTCWRCAGTGLVPNLVPIKPNQQISPEAEADDAEGGSEGAGTQVPGN